MSVVKDRRSSLRVAVEGRALVHTERDQFEGRCIDLGLDGIAVRSTRSTRSRKCVTLEVLIHGQRLRFDAVLARRQRLGGDYLMGLCFVDLDLDTRRRIEHLVFERLAGTPQAGFMRAFVAHAERVPPPLAARYEAPEHTVVSGTLHVPVISGHTQIIDVGLLPMLDRTMIAPAPTRSDAVLADAAPAYAPPPVMAPVRFDDSWFDDEMDTAQFRLLEAAQLAQGHAAEDPIELELEPEIEIEPEIERTLVTRDTHEPPTATERTLVTRDTHEPPTATERTLVTRDTHERPPAERTAVLPRLHHPSSGAGVPEPIAVVHTPTATMGLGFGSHTVPVRLGVPSPPPLLRGEAGEPVTLARIPPALVLRPSLRALLDAAALLRRPNPAPRRGPRVIVSIPHRSYRRVAAEPWNR